LSGSPTQLVSPGCLGLGAIGILESGVLLYNGLDEKGKDAVANEIQDSCDGHPEQSGKYHHHNLSRCIASKNTAKTTKLVGYTFDGYGIYEEFDASGNRLKNADLDVCHGRTSSVNWNGSNQSVYHYVVTDEYPYTLGCFRAQPQ
jgi:hypothetical protein